ncbi:MAG: redoxin domain-containing protein [Polyangiaceae bacterium]|nr:redoxin domain-containing protein [Polyangiaceae bacterium]
MRVPRPHKAEFEKKNAVIYGVSFHTKEENKAFAEKFSFNFPLPKRHHAGDGPRHGAADSKTEGFAKRAGVVIGPDGKIRGVPREGRRLRVSVRRCSSASNARALRNRCAQPVWRSARRASRGRAPRLAAGLCRPHPARMGHEC